MGWPKMKKEKRKDEIFDLGEALEEIAWAQFVDEFVESSCCGCSEKQAKRAFKVKIDWRNIGRKDVVSCYGDSQGGYSSKSIKNLQVFQTTFKNTTGYEGKQKFTFNFQKQVTSSNELSVKSGYSIGGKLNLAPKLEGSKIGLPGMALEGGLEISASWSGEKGHVIRNEESVTWNMNSEVELDKGQTVYVTAEVEQAEVETDIIITTHIWSKVFHGRLPVDIIDRKDNSVYAVIDLPCSKLEEHLGAKGKIKLKEEAPPTGVQPTPPRQGLSGVAHSDGEGEKRRLLEDPGIVDSSSAQPPQPRQSPAASSDPPTDSGFTITTDARIKMVCTVGQNIVISENQPAEKRTIVMGSAPSSEPPLTAAKAMPLMVADQGANSRRTSGSSASKLNRATKRLWALRRPSQQNQVETTVL